ncbi:MAG: hypothetical protein R2939_08500 [Kofleriaceae bacterium]
MLAPATPISGRPSASKSAIVGAGRAPPGMANGWVRSAADGHSASVGSAPHHSSPDCPSSTWTLPSATITTSGLPSASRSAIAGYLSNAAVTPA